MNKVFGIKSDYAPVKDDASRMVICYGQESVDDENATWYEVYLYKARISQVTLDMVKNAVIEDINARTDETILTGFVWTPAGSEQGINVWLSAENQRNFSEAQRMAEKYGDAVLPLTFKLGETEDGTPVYHTFETTAELDDFYVKAFSYVNHTLSEGWAEKDAVDWTPYEALFPAQEQTNAESE